MATIAEIGRGRYYETTDPSTVPQIFTKETMQASKSAIKEDVYAVGERRHVGTFGDDCNAIVDEVLSVLGIDFVLCGTGECRISLNRPQRVVVKA